MKRDIALVLSSGGARGLAHIGVIEALEAEGFHIRSVAGSSMGAVVGGIYAAGKLPDYKTWVCNLDKLDVFKLVDFTFSRMGLIRGERVFQEIKKITGELAIEELDVPFTAVATDLLNKEEVIFREGSLFDALRASTAIPTVLTPFMLHDRLLVDGGVLNPLPVKFVNRHPDDLLVVVDVNADIPFFRKVSNDPASLEAHSAYHSKVQAFMKRWQKLNAGQGSEKKPGLFNLLNRSFDLMQDRLTEMMVQAHKPDLLIRVSRNASGTFEFYRAEEIIELGKQAAYQSLEKHHSQTWTYQKAE